MKSMILTHIVISVSFLFFIHIYLLAERYIEMQIVVYNFEYG